MCEQLHRDEVFHGKYSPIFCFQFTRRKQEHEAFLAHFSFSFCTELIYEVLDETIKETAASEIQ